MRWQLPLVATLALVATVGCGDDDPPTGPTTSIYGTYQLVSVDGVQVPAPFPPPIEGAVIMDGALTLNFNSSVKFSLTVETSSGEIDASSLDGVVEQTGDAFDFVFDDGDGTPSRATGTLSGSTMSFVWYWEEYVYSFVK